MKKLAMLTIAVALLGGSLACTSNQMARQFCGTATETLKPGEKLVNVTWKRGDLWIVTRPMRADEHPETYTFRERSAFGGVLEGAVILKETR